MRAAKGGGGRHVSHRALDGKDGEVDTEEERDDAEGLCGTRRVRLVRGEGRGVSD